MHYMLLSKNIKKLRFIIPLVFITTIVINCSNKQNSVEPTFHPITERIPYYNYTHQPITKNILFNKSFEKELPVVNLLHQYLQDSTKLDFKELKFLARDAYQFDAVSINNHRIILLDKLANRLIEHDLKDDVTTNLAQKGQGPGDINFPQGISKNKGIISIALADMRISEFNCANNPCSHQRTVKLDFRPYSLATADDKMAILGSINVGNTGNKIKMEDKLQEIKPIYILNIDGEEIKNFGDAYDTEGHWMLLRPLVNNGKIRYLHSEHIFALAYDRFPFIYLYNSNYELEKVYKIDNFIIGKQKYWPKEGRRRIVKQDHSLIRNLQVIKDNYLLLEIEKKTNESIADNRRMWDRSFEYYLVDISNDRSYYLGIISSNNKQSIYLMDNGMLINKNGTLYFKAPI